MRIKVLTAFTLFIISIGCKKEKTRICDLYDGKVNYAIGTIDKVRSSPGKATYTYYFEVGGTSYTGKEKAYGIGQNDESLIGKRFVVVFAFGNPENNDLNTDFLIESDSDFQAFLNKYQNAPPPKDFPEKCK